jgi:hypothetical protein
MINSLSVTVASKQVAQCGCIKLRDEILKLLQSVCCRKLSRRRPCHF